MVSLFDPKNWAGEKNYGNGAITSFAGHFQATLAAAGYDSDQSLQRNYVKVWHRNAKAKDLWQRFIDLRRCAYTNVRALAQI